MEFYIATGLDNTDEHQKVMDYLIKCGHKCTYDWTKHGAVWEKGFEVVARTALAELEAVRQADFVVVIRPKGRGTHTELGAALILGKPCFLLDYAEAKESCLSIHHNTCAFHFHPGTIRIPIKGLNLSGVF